MNTTDKIAAFLGGEDRHSANSHITNIQKYRSLWLFVGLCLEGGNRVVKRVGSGE